MLALLALVLGSAGCGGSNETTASAISKPQYIKRADKVCNKTEARQKALFAKFSEKAAKKPGSTEVELVAFAGVPPLRKQAEELAALPAPSTGAREAAAYLRAFEEGVKAAKKKPALLLNAESNPFIKAEALARKFGLEVCRGA